MSEHQMQLPLDGPRPIEIQMAEANAEQFTEKFLAYLPENLHVYQAFTREAFKVIRRGFQHYSARTIIEVLRHQSALSEVPGVLWKLNDHNTPYLVRLFCLLHPQHTGLWELRRTRAAERDHAEALEDQAP